MNNTKRKTNEKLATSLALKISSNIKWGLVFIGNPLYLTVIALFIAFLYGTSLIGFATRIIIEKSSSNVKRYLIFSVVLIARIYRFIRKLTYVLKDIWGNLVSLVKKFSNKSLNYKRPKLNLPKLSFHSFPKPTLSRIKINRPHLPRFRLSAKIFVVFLLFVTATSMTFWFFVMRDLPAPSELTNRKIDVSTKIYDRNGELLYTIYKDENRTIIPFSEIPKQVRLATLAAEDAEFYNHPGFSVRGMIRSVINNLEKGELTGGSTITQQLVKNALLTPEKTILRKLKEIALAVHVELTYSKDQILEMYLNEVSYGGTAYGIQEASQAYFGKSTTDLTLSEAAYLAGLPKSPSKFSPFSGNFEAGINRQKDILNLMKVNGFITEEAEQEALSYNLQFSSSKTDIKAPHFVMFVRQALAEKYGEEAVETGGLEVVTTLDYKVQKFAEEVLKSEIESLKKLNVGNGSVVVLDPKTGEILAMVGSYDYFDLAGDGNVNVAVSPRPPGSSIKVINYAYALSNNYTPATIIDDSPITYNLPGQAPYTPKNYDGKFRGRISLRSALAESRNIPAVKVLESYGVNKMIELGQKLGITTWADESRFGLSLTLGGGEVKLLDLAQVYSTISNYGVKNDVWSIKKVTNYKGKVLENNVCTPNNTGQAPFACEGERVLDSRVAYMLTDILKDNLARSPAFGRASQLVIPNHPEVAVKTGTSNELRDNLTVGYNQNFLVAVWVGNNDNSPMSRIASGLTGASSIFHKIMTGLLSDTDSITWDVPSGIKQTAVCTFTGTLPCGSCPTKNELFLEENSPSRACRQDQILVLEDERGNFNWGYSVDAF